MREIKIDIAGVPAYSTFSNSDSVQGKVDLIDISSIGTSFAFANPIATSSEITFTIPRFAGPVDLYDIYGVNTEKEVVGKAKLKTTMHKGDTTLVLQSALSGVNGYVHIKTECMSVSASTLNPNTNYTVGRGALNTREIPFFVSDINLEEQYVTTQPCFWKGRVFTIYIKEKVNWVKWYVGLLSRNPVIGDNRIQFAGVFIENIISGDVFNSLETTTTTLAPVVKIGRKCPGYISARNKIYLPEPNYVSGSAIGTNSYDATTTFVVSSRATGASKEHFRNICLNDTGEKTTTCRIPVELSTRLANFEAVGICGGYDSVTHSFLMTVECESSSSPEDVISPASMLLPAVCGVCLDTSSYSGVITVDSLDFPTAHPSYYDLDDTLTLQGQINTGNTPIAFFEQDYYDNSSNGIVLHKVAVCPYSYGIVKHIGFVSRYHTKEKPEKIDYASVKQSFAARQWLWNSSHDAAKLFKIDGSARFLYYPFRPITQQKENDDRLDDFTIFVGKEKQAIQQTVAWYSLNVHTDGRTGEELRGGAQRRNIDFERAKAFWEAGMDFVYLTSDLATEKNRGSYFQVKWTEVAIDGNTTELTGQMRLKRDSYYDTTYTAIDGNGVQQTYTAYAYKVLKADYNRYTPLIAFGSWPSGKNCEITKTAHVQYSQTLLADLLISCEGSNSSFYDILPIGYNIPESYLDMPQILANNCPFKGANLVGSVKEGSSIAETFLQSYLITSVSGLIGKHIDSAQKGWDYKISRTDLMADTLRSSVAVASFDDSSILNVPSITPSADIYTGYSFKFKQDEQDLNIKVNDRTAMAEFGANNTIDLDMTRFALGLDEDPTARCAEVASSLHELLGYPQKEIQIRVPFDKALFLNLGDVVNITSKYLNNKPWKTVTHPGRVLSIQHNIKAGVTDLVVSVIDSTAEGYCFSLEMTFNPEYYLNNDLSTTGGLREFVKFFMTAGNYRNFCFDTLVNNPYNGGSLDLDNYTRNAAAIMGIYTYDIVGNTVMVWMPQFPGVYAECQITSITRGENLLWLGLTVVTPGVSTTHGDYCDNSTSLTKTYDIKFEITTEPRLFVTNSSRIQL